MRGGRGSDTIFGDLGVDVLFGDRDDDFLFGGEGNDVLLGGPECRPGGAEADGPGAVAASRPGHDQAAGGGRGSAALDLLPHVPGDGDHGVSVERGDARARAADRRARVAEDDEALRPDGGHDRVDEIERIVI